MKNLKAFIGYGRCTYLEILDKNIELAKDLFVLDLGFGNEISIPPNL